MVFRDSLYGKTARTTRKLLGVKVIGKTFQQASEMLRNLQVSMKWVKYNIPRVALGVNHCLAMISSFALDFLRDLEEVAAVRIFELESVTQVLSA